LTATVAPDAHGTWRGDHHCHRTDHGSHRTDHGQRRCRRDGEARRSSTTVRFVPGELLVRFRPAASEAERRQAVENVGGTITAHLVELALYVVEVPPERTGAAREALRRAAAVGAVEQDIYVDAFDTTPNDPFWSTQWGWRHVGAPRAWDVTRSSEDVVVAVLDTGVNGSHPDLAGAVAPGYDFVNGDLDPLDDQGHGTSAAGVIAARADNALGLAGMCWRCRIMPVKVLDAGGVGKTSTIAAGLVWAADRGARIINLSLGAPGTTLALESAVQYAAGKGAVLVAAAGNSGTDTRFYPAAYEQTLSVAGTTESDVLYAWSNFGSWVKVAAPGCNTAPGGTDAYVQFCGTSSAAPLVSGIAALVLSQKPAATRQEIELAVTEGVAKVTGVRHGRVSAASAVGAATSGTTTPQPPAQPTTTPAPPASPQAPAATPVAPTPTATPPVLVARPLLRGLARFGRTLRATPGSWRPGPARVTYRWRHCAPSGRSCRAVPQARKQTLLLTRSFRGRRIQALVTASNATASATFPTGMSSIVRAASGRRR
jgi:subtilisin family serine protease